MTGAEPAGQVSGLGPDERDELDRLRAENHLLRTERDILVRLATGIARDTGLLRDGTDVAGETDVYQH